MPLDLQLAELKSGDPLAEVALGWVVAEWGLQPGQSEADLLERLLASHDCPATHLALIGLRPIGMNSFTRHALGGAPGRLLWIDVLYVLPEYRGRGVGARLLALGEGLACEHAPELFAYTSVPSFYAEKGWQLVERRDDGHGVLKRVLGRLEKATGKTHAD